MWQDYAVTSVVYMFVVVTIPLVRDVIKRGVVVNLWTALPTSFGNYSLAVIFGTLGLWISTTSATLIATMWLIIFIFSWRNKND